MYLSIMITLHHLAIDRTPISEHNPNKNKQYVHLVKPLKEIANKNPM